MGLWHCAPSYNSTSSSTELGRLVALLSSYRNNILTDDEEEEDITYNDSVENDDTHGGACWL